MAEVKFYLCEQCGNVAVKLVDNGPELSCCGETMVELDANTKDAAVEKHVPEVKREGNKLEVVVGSTPHPMEEEHYITFIAVVQGEKIQVANLKPGQEPKANFNVDEGPAVVYEFCNIHGLWKAEA